MDPLKLGSGSAAYGTYNGGLAPFLPLRNKLAIQINLDGDGFQEVTLPVDVGTTTDLSQVATAIQTAVKGLTKKKASTDAVAFSGFACTTETVPRLVLRSGTTSEVSSVRVQPAATNDATWALKLGSGNGGQSENGLALRRPALADVVQIGDAAVAGVVTAAVPGSDGTAILTETSFSNAFPRLDTVTDFSLLAVPGEGTTAMMDLDA